MMTMRDLLIITPTRGRPAGAQRLIDAVTATAVADTDLMLAVDEDDSSYAGLTGRFETVRGPRATCAGWSNLIAATWAREYRAVASIGDDHVPETPEWDSLLLHAITKMGGTGIAYGDDGHQHKAVPTAVVVSSDIVAALGWLFMPTLAHFYADLVWKDLAEGHCLAYLPDVKITHYNPTFGTAAMDSTYAEARAGYGTDCAAYQAWYAGKREADIATVRDLLKKP